ncbi:10072_t:CDS:2 [Funneliformis geosporum]|uniref:15410_t:CDS:1 n=1 Tax=Funneliformis geosporum TaxID=1117311 RepID=A0A9W4SB91_9GLOM|nr:10072_t:CDS:2 [Funneliformis geosporum]CAI2163460.1 15410_t:CDS:2 [Funneliformis geosporum]
MSVKVDGFKSSLIFEQLKVNITDNEEKKKQTIKKVNAVFEINVKNQGGKEQVWTLDLKKDGKVQVGKGPAKPDITISLSDDTFVELASGKINGQKAFMSGKLKIKGNMMLATKLDGVFATIPKAKL